MAISLHITATDAADLHDQLMGLLQGASPSQVIVKVKETNDDERIASGFIQPTAPLATTTPAKPTVVRGTRAKKDKAAEAATEETQPEAPAPADPSKVRGEAVALLRTVYSKGEPGEKAVADICTRLAVTKLVDVPLTRADELLAMAQAAHVAVVGPLPTA